MHQRAFLLLFALLGAAMMAGVPAQAQFYDLDGTYHCLTKTDAACAAAGNAVPGAPPAPPPAGPTIDQVIAHIKAQKVSAEDMKLLEGHAANHEPRAVEALAWCRLNGIGGKPDALEAFFLYGEAARLGVPNAQANQTSIFESRLSQQQRQDALMQLQTQTK
jgi:TPR repeat protein